MVGNGDDDDDDDLREKMTNLNRLCELSPKSWSVDNTHGGKIEFQVHHHRSFQY